MTFHNIVKDREIMLLEKKIIQRVNFIEFPGMKISNVTYVLQLYITVHLSKFLDSNLTKK